MKNNLFTNSSLSLSLSLVKDKYSKILIGSVLLAVAAFIASGFLFVNLVSAAATGTTGTTGTTGYTVKTGITGTTGTTGYYR